MGCIASYSDGLLQDAARWAELSVAAALAVFPRAEFETWAQCERILSHARAALDALQKDAEPLTAADLARRCVFYLWARGEYGAAERLGARALAILENALGPDHPDVARALDNLVCCTWNWDDMQSRAAFTRRWHWEIELGPIIPALR